jgi:acetyl esterase/lipase
VYARPLLHAFARHGWICISASYRLRPATYGEMLTDVKRVVAWARQHAADFGADPSRIVLGGSSAGAHLAITAALTPHHRRFQPGFDDVDTAVIAAFGLYGYYGPAQPTGPPSSPAAYANAAAPPVMIVHGAHDTLVPADSAEHLADTIRACTTTPVVYAELPGAQHTFDLLHSLRCELVIDALWSFCTWAAHDRPRITGPRCSHPAGSTSSTSPLGTYEPHHPSPGQGRHIDD